MDHTRTRTQSEDQGNLDESESQGESEDYGSNEENVQALDVPDPDQGLLGWLAQGQGFGEDVDWSLEDETLDEARARISAKVDEAGAAVQGFLSDLGNLRTDVFRKRRTLTRHREMLEGIDQQVEECRAVIQKLRQDLEDPDMSDELRTDRRARLDQQVVGMHGLVARKANGDGKQVLDLDRAMEALRAGVNERRPAFDAAIAALKALGREAGFLGLDDLVLRIDALKRKAALRHTMDVDYEHGSLGDFARDLGLDVPQIAPPVRERTLRGERHRDPRHLDGREFTHLGCTLNTEVPGREDFVSLRHNRQIDTDIETGLPWTGEREDRVAAQIEALLGLVDDAWTRHCLALDELRLVDPDVDETEVLSVFMGPEWFFGGSRIYNAAQKEQVVQAIVEASAMYPELLIVPGSILWSPNGEGILNTAPVAMDGSLLREVSKKLPAGDAFDTERYIHLDHEDRGEFVDDESQFLKVGDLNVAIEICADTGSARAKREMYSRAEPGPGVDLHLVLSSGQTLNRWALTSDVGGYALLSDCEQEQGTTMVAQVQQDGTSHAERRAEPVGDHFDNGRGQRSTNRPLPIQRGQPMERMEDMEVPRYDPFRKDEYRRLNLRHPDRSRRILENMLAYAREHLRDGGRTARRSRVEGMIEAATPFVLQPSDPNCALAQHVIAKLEQLETVD